MTLTHERDEAIRATIAQATESIVMARQRNELWTDAEAWSNMIDLLSAYDAQAAKLAEAVARAEKEATAFKGLSVLWRAKCRSLDAANARIAAMEKALDEMEARKDGAYRERNQVVAALAALSLSHGYSVCLTKTAIEGWSDDWHGCIYIQLPTGQVSWHFHDSHAELFNGLPHGSVTWDGHDTPEKYRRLAALQPRSEKEGRT